MTLLSMHNIP